MNTQTLLVPGASGQVGRFLLPLLAVRGYAVLAVSRHGPPVGYPDLEGVHWYDAGQSLPRADGMISAGPLAVAMDLVRRCTGLRRVVAFSTTSVQTKRASPDVAERALVASIADTEAALRAQCADLDCALTILRPTLIYGCGMDRNLSLLSAWIRRFGWLPIAGAAAGQRQPVHAEDLAIAALAAYESDAATGQVIDLPGGETLSFHDMASRLFSALGKRPRLVSLPPGLLAGIARVARWVPGLVDVKPGMVLRQSTDLVFDGGPARRLLDFRPRPFHPGADDFQPPTAQRLRAFALRHGCSR